MFIGREAYDFLVEIIRATKDKHGNLRAASIRNGDFDNSLEDETERAINLRYRFKEFYPDDLTYDLTFTDDDINGPESTVQEVEGDFTAVNPFSDARSDTDVRFLGIDNVDEWLAVAYSIANQVRKENEDCLRSVFLRDAQIKDEAGFKRGYRSAQGEATRLLREKSIMLQTSQAQHIKLVESNERDRHALEQQAKQKLNQLESANRAQLDVQFSRSSEQLRVNKLLIQQLKDQILELTPESNREADPLDLAFACVKGYFRSTPQTVIDTIKNKFGVIEMNKLALYEAGLILEGLRRHFKLNAKSAKKIRIDIVDCDTIDWIGKSKSITSNVKAMKGHGKTYSKYETLGVLLFDALQAMNAS
jgi:hypothetical protein